MADEKAQDVEQSAEPKVEARPAAFSELNEHPGQPGMSLDLVLDISMPVTAELGRTTMTVRELLQLGTGTVVELDRAAGEPVDLLVRDVRFARGEVVVVGNSFGLRVTEVLSPSGRLRELGKAHKQVDKTNAR